MFRAMVWKELREVRGIALLALLANGYMLVAATHPDMFPFIRGNNVPFIFGQFLMLVLWICVPTAIALGYRQTLGESISGTYPFLFHRSLARSWLIGTKLLVGAAVYLACNMVFIVGHGLWAATPGTHAGPFEWSMTVPCWIAWFGVLVLYLGAFLSGLRPGRWFGTRTLPLVGAGLITTVTTAIAILDDELLGLSLVLVAIAWMIVAILFVARTQDFS
jgi:hypothetical protein